MTKKADKAARVEANKKAAYVKKVRALIGFVGTRASDEWILNHYDVGSTAEAAALATIANEPVAKVVFPLKADAINSAEKWAHEEVAKMAATLEAAGWDLNVVAPRPSYNDANYTRRARFSLITKDKGDRVARTGFEKVQIVEIDDKSVEHFVKIAMEDAGLEYDLFVLKLVSKVGAVDSAELDGSHVWSESILTVRKGATVERWKTQQIANYSVYDKYFPQWPTRLMKGGAK